MIDPMETSDRVLLGKSIVAAIVMCALLVFDAVPARGTTGEEWRRLPPAARRAYVSAIVDAWAGLVMVQESLGTRDAAITVFTPLVSCVRDGVVSEERVAAAVESYVTDNPGLRSKEMPDIVYAALNEECKKR